MGTRGVCPTLGRSLHSCKGDRTGILSPPDARRRRRQQLVEYRPALSILRLVYMTTPGAPVYTTTPRPLRYKRPLGPSISLRTTLLQDPAYTATNGSWAALSDKGLQQRSTERPCTSRSSLYGYQWIPSCKRPRALALHSRRRPSGPGDCFVPTLPGHPGVLPQ
jgi:hypothetical protein